MVITVFQLFTRPFLANNHFLARAKESILQKHRKTETDIEVRIRKTIIQIPIGHTSIRTIIPTTAEQQTTKRQNAE